MCIYNIGQSVYTDALCMHYIGQLSHIVTYIVHMNCIGRFVHKRQDMYGIGHSLHRRHVQEFSGYGDIVPKASFW